MKIVTLLSVLVTATALVAADSLDDRFARMTPAEVRAFEMDVARRVADLALISPTLNTSPLPQYDYDKLDYGMTIGIERTPKGRLWACWVAGGGAAALLAVSGDHGRTWSPSRISKLPMATSKPAVSVLSTG
jgi:hypothetical protein